MTKLIFITSRSIPVDNFAQNDLKPQVTQRADDTRHAVLPSVATAICPAWYEFRFIWSFSFIKN